VKYLPSVAAALPPTSAANAPVVIIFRQSGQRAAVVASMGELM
jgi:hypothetical protein